MVSTAYLSVMVPPSPSFKRPTSLRPSGLSAAFRQIPTPKRHLHPMVRAQPILNASFGLMPQGPPGNGPKGLSETVTESRGTPGHQSVKRAPRKGRFLGRLIHPTQRYALRGKRCHLRGVTDVPAIATAAEHAVGAPAAAGGGAGQLLQHVGQAHVLPRQLHKPCSKGDRERACVQLRVFGGIGFHLIDPSAQRGPRLRQLRCANSARCCADRRALHAAECLLSQRSPSSPRGSGGDPAPLWSRY